LHVPYRFQYADIFTKGLPSTLFDEFHDSFSGGDGFLVKKNDKDVNLLKKKRKRDEVEAEYEGVDVDKGEGEGVKVKIGEKRKGVGKGDEELLVAKEG
nr:ribonuclease H-like domain-containing protein [Tanacetum cinerariifolium]